MNNKELKKFKRKELLLILLEQARKIECLERENIELKEKINSRNIELKETGSLAEAALKLTEIFKEADKAAELYLESVKENNKPKKVTPKIIKKDKKYKKSKKGVK